MHLRPIATRRTASLRLGASLSALVLCGLGGANGQDFEGGGFAVSLDPGTQTVDSLSAEASPALNFTMEGEAADGFYRLGDLDLRLKRGDADWTDYSSAFERAAIDPIAVDGPVLAAADLSGTFGADFPLSVERRWLEESGALVMRVSLTNEADEPVEIGGLGLSMVFANDLTGKSLDEAHRGSVFYDPYVGLDAGYLQVTRLNGEGPVLLVLPEEDTPFADYKPILDVERDASDEAAPCEPVLLKDCIPRGITFEGHYDWMVETAGFAGDWASEGAWNPLSSATLAPGETRTVGLRFLTAPTIREIDETLAAAGHPVAVGFPGYVLPEGTTADLFVKADRAVADVSVAPEGALTVEEAEDRGDWRRYRVTGTAWGPSRLTLRYEDGTEQTVHYRTTKAPDAVMNDLGAFLFDEQWFDEEDAPFGRSPSIMSYDREEDAIVRQDDRVWIAGLSDEGGAGAWLAAIAKQLVDPDPEEIAKFERFYDETIEGGLQITEGEKENGVRKSLFYYDPEAAPDVAYSDDLDWSLWSAWNEEAAHDVVRSFNYVHVSAAQWILYKLARNYEGLVSSHDWRYYLDHAAQTAIAMVELAPHYAEFGQMEGDVFVEILNDLRREGMTERADALESVMDARADRWRTLDYPFGSEMPWDSTGQPEVHAWMRHFGDDEKADLTREVILAYDPAIPHWGYNGSARRYWDFIFAGKTQRIERQLHHYGSALNAVPLLADYRRNPDDFHLLKVGYAGMMGALTNIDEDGFGSAAYHSFPDMRAFDGYSGDYGMGFFGHAFATESVLVDHDTFGWLGFGGTVEEARRRVTLTPRDTARRRVFIAPESLGLTLDAGQFERVTYDPRNGRVTATLVPEGDFAPAAKLGIEAGGADYTLKGRYDSAQGRWTIPLEADGTTITLRRR